MLEQITGIKETCLYIHDLEAARRFYHDKLHLPLIHYDPGKHIFFRAGRSVLLCFNPDDSRYKKSPPPHYAEGNQHLAFEVEPEDYELIKTRFKNAGIKILDKLVWGSGQESFYFEDPEKNVLEIVPRGVWD
jgi:catechol 2,3-dioxygenase-like lactoylglutathione lyase family enzyme